MSHPSVDRVALIRKLIEGRLDAEHLEIEDNSAEHLGHPGAAAGGGHFRVLVVSAAFRDQDVVSRQRAVYAALGDALPSQIHALALRTLTPEEWRAARGRPRMPL